MYIKNIEERGSFWKMIEPKKNLDDSCKGHKRKRFVVQTKPRGIGKDFIYLPVYCPVCEKFVGKKKFRSQ